MSWLKVMTNQTEQLTQKRCQPCEGTGQSLTSAEIKPYLARVPEWKLNAEGTMISREFITKNFMAAVQFINQVAAVAENENHHPDFHLTGYRRLRVDLSTHAVKGLSENDFIMAAKIDQLPVELKTPGR